MSCRWKLIGVQVTHIDVPPGYDARRPTPDDAEAIAALVAASQASFGYHETVSAEDILSDWEGLDLTDIATVVVAPNGELAACADIDNRRNVVVAVYGYVHPIHQGRGLGTALVQWGERWAREHIAAAPPDARVLTQHYIPIDNPAGRTLLEGLGYAQERVVYKMQIDLHAAAPTTPLPDGLLLRGFVAGQDERAVFEAIEDAFQDRWGSVGNDYDEWLKTTVSQRTSAQHWHIAQEMGHGAIAGVCLGYAAGGAGWIHAVGVRRPWRQQGVGHALLLRAFESFRRAGVRSVGLSVDSSSSTGAPRLYTAAGMDVTQRYIVYTKTLRAGRDMRHLVGE